MENKGLVAGVVIALVLGVAGIFMGSGATGPQGPAGPQGPVGLGAAAGPEHTEHQRFLQSFTKGGSVTSTTTVDTTIVLGTGHAITRNTSYLSFNIGVDATVTTMASSSAPLRDLAAGESLTMYFYNASTTAASTATFAAGTGVDLQEDEGETVIVNGLEVARLTFLKKADTDVIAWVEVGQVGD